jgi:hypothetical protein
MYSVSGIPSDGGAATLYGPYVVKNVPGVGRGISTIVVQNMGTAREPRPHLHRTRWRRLDHHKRPADGPGEVVGVRPPALSDDTQYSAVLDGGGQNIAAIVTELNYSGGVVSPDLGHIRPSGDRGQ